MRGGRLKWGQWTSWSPAPAGETERGRGTQEAPCVERTSNSHVILHVEYNIYLIMLPSIFFFHFWAFSVKALFPRHTLLWPLAAPFFRRVPTVEKISCELFLHLTVRKCQALESTARAAHLRWATIHESAFNSRVEDTIGGPIGGDCTRRSSSSSKHLKGVEHAEHEPLLLPFVGGIFQRVLGPIPLPVVQALTLRESVSSMYSGEANGADINFRRKKKMSSLLKPLKRS